MAQANDAELRITASLDDKITSSIEQLSVELNRLSEAAKGAFDVAKKSAKEAGAEAINAAKATSTMSAAATEATADIKTVGPAATASFGDAADAAKASAASFNAAAEASKKTKETVATIGDVAKKTGSEMADAGQKGAKGFGEIKDKLKDIALGLFGVQQAFSVFKNSIQDTITTAQEVDVLNARLRNFANLTDEAFNTLADDLRTFSLINKQFVKDQKQASLASANH